MTAPMTVMVQIPAGWKIRAVKTCPAWCVATDDDHATVGDDSHYGAGVGVIGGPAIDPEAVPLDAWLVSQDGGDTQIEFGPTRTGNWRWSPQQTQEFMAYLSTLLHTVGESSPGDSARAAQAAAAMTLRGLLLAGKFHPAVALTITAVVGVLDAGGNTNEIVDEAALHRWMDLTTRINGVRGLMRDTTDIDEHGGHLTDAIALTKERDALLPDGLAPVVRNRGR